MFATGETLGLAEWIIDDTPVLFFFLLHDFHIWWTFLHELDKSDIVFT